MLINPPVFTQFKHLQSHLEVQAEHFYTTRTQRKVFKALLDYAIHQRLEAWDRERQADEYSARSANYPRQNTSLFVRFTSWLGVVCASGEQWADVSLLGGVCQRCCRRKESKKSGESSSDAKWPRSSRTSDPRRWTPCGARPHTSNENETPISRNVNCWNSWKILYKIKKIQVWRLQSFRKLFFCHNQFEQLVTDASWYTDQNKQCVVETDKNPVFFHEVVFLLVCFLTRL